MKNQKINDSLRKVNSAFNIIYLKIRKLRLTFPMAILWLLFSTELIGQYKPYSLEGKNTISFSINGDITEFPDSLDIRLVYHPDILSPKSIIDVIRLSKKNLQLEVPADKLISIQFQPFKKQTLFYDWILEPGDSVAVSFEHNSLVIKGRGAESLKIGNEISQLIRNSLKSKKLSYLVTKSANDYLHFAKDMDRLWTTIDTILESHRSIIPAKTFDFIKASALDVINYQQSSKFFSLYLELITEDSYSEKTGKMLNNLYDSIYSNAASFKEHKKLPIWIVAKNAYRRSVKNAVLRELNFPKRFVYKDNLHKIIECGKKEFRGMAEDYFLYEVLTELIIDDIGFNEETESILEAYYKETNNPGYKAYVRKHELNARRLDPGKKAPEILVSGVTDKKIRKIDFTNKVTLLDFEVSGENQSLLRNEVLQNIREKFKNDTNLLVLKVNAAVTGKQILRAYNILDSSYAYLIDHTGKVVTGPMDMAALGSQKFLTTLEEQLDVLRKFHWITTNDGPYLIKEGQIEKAYSVKSNKVVIDSISRDKSTSLNISTDLPDNTFKVILKDKLIVEEDMYDKPGKLLALSDIEGNFDALRKLLLKNGVINASFDWTFGKGHLVLIGDMVDRGKQVTECLWLIYSLEQKAKTVGGYVHFILGNHEIMNLSGDLRYVQKKYIDNAKLLNRNFVKDLYGPASELGKWLRTKNIIEKIGDLLFVHAGISKEINDLNLSISEINQLARSFYDKSTIAIQSADKRLSLVYNTSLSPFWYRNYYQVDSLRIGVSINRLDTTYKTPTQVIKEVLTNFNVNKIVTGHTIYKGANNYGKSVSIHYAGRVINTDTRHASGHSEALYVENDRYYRVDIEGIRRELVVETDRAK